MKFIQHYSSSKGNLYQVVADNGKRLLLECGVTWQLAERALNYNLKNIVGCLITHEHKDHCRCVREVQRAGIKVYSSTGTSHAMDMENGYKNYCINSKKRGWFNLWPDKTFNVMGLPANHDSADPLFFVIKADDEYLLFAPDTSFIKQEFDFSFSIIAIECSYDIAILQARVEAEDINETFAKRLLNSHMEKTVAMKYISQYCKLEKCTELHLLHCSKDNLDINLAKEEFEKAFFIKVITI
jgi:phosphoribosyl 1,2-cyclic phosphodiesterase